jgi:hypothetical protein
MALSRTAVFLLLLPAPAAVYLTTTTEDVNASGQCLPSAEAVRQQYPGAWPSWTTRTANHKGEKCWFPAMRENHAHHIEAALRRTAQKLMHRDKDAQSEGGEPGVGVKAAAEKPVAFAAEMNQLGWSFRTRSANVGPAPATVSSAVDTEDSSSFEDRFAASRNVTYVQKPSLIQRMMDPVGAIPNIP